MLEQVRRYGRPHIGWLGIRVQALTPDIADVLAIDRHSGAIIAEVAADGPGGRAGLQIGDVVQGFAHETVTDYRELNRAVMMSVGKTMKLRIWRKGQTRIVSMTVKEWPQEIWQSYQSGAARDLLYTKVSDHGFQIADIDDGLRSHFGLEKQVSGAIVTAVSEDTAASGAKLRPGDVVLTGSNGGGPFEGRARGASHRILR
jgi:serine protease Do